MQYTEAHHGRVFIIRLEDGEIIHEAVERFAAEHGIRAAALILVGGAKGGSRIVAGPADGQARPVLPMEEVLGDIHEIAGAGTIFPDESGAPVLHMHAACGRGKDTLTGCVRRGVGIWQIGEVVLIELAECTAVREKKKELGFSVLNTSPDSRRSATPRRKR